MIEPDTARAYLAAVADRLVDLPHDEREAIMAELVDHFAESARAGRDASAVIDALGDPASLARAYATEVSGQPSRPPRTDAVFRVIGVLASLGLPSVVIVTVLAAVGVACVAGGAAGFFLSLFAPVLPAAIVPPDLKRAEGLIWGLPLVALGLVSLTGLLIYVRGVMRVVGQTARGRPISLDWDLLPPLLRRRAKG